MEIMWFIYEVVVRHSYKKIKAYLNRSIHSRKMRGRDTSSKTNPLYGPHLKAQEKLCRISKR